MAANYTDPSGFLKSTTRLYFAPLRWVARLLRRVWDRSWASVASLPKPRAAGRLHTPFLSTNLKAAEALQRSALNYVTKEHDASAAAALLSDLAMTYLKEGNIKEAEESIIHALDADPLIQGTPAFLVALGNIGCDYHLRGNLDKAEEYYLKALRSCDIIDRDHLAALYFNLGLISHKRRDFDKATSYFESGILIDKELHNWAYLAHDYLYLFRAMTRRKIKKV